MKDFVRGSLILGTIVLFFGLVIFYRENAQTLPTASISAKPLAKVDSSPEINLTELYNLVNAERTKVGLTALTNDPLIAQSAQEKCNAMVTADSWSHNLPDGTTPWVFIKRHNVYLTAGENLTYGYDNAGQITRGWMNSPKHKENILRADFNRVGYAQCFYPPTSKQGDNTLVVQMFTN